MQAWGLVPDHSAGESAGAPAAVWRRCRWTPARSRESWKCADAASSSVRAVRTPCPAPCRVST